MNYLNNINNEITNSSQTNNDLHKVICLFEKKLNDLDKSNITKRQKISEFIEHIIEKEKNNMEQSGIQMMIIKINMSIDFLGIEINKIKKEIFNVKQEINKFKTKLEINEFEHKNDLLPDKMEEFFLN